MAYRSSEHETTKLSPCMLMFAREIELPIDFIYGPHPQRDEFPNETETAKFNAYVQKVQTLMWDVQQKARKNIITASNRQKRQYDLRANHNSYKVGDSVWLNILARMRTHQRVCHGVTKLSVSEVTIPATPLAGKERVRPYNADLLARTKVKSLDFKIKTRSPLSPQD
ncbi:unnamed protein product [Mytilus edulis]|uniref:Uncharacterized protein n=1 Tax=Mytilus edulis TaxID=6550 RepID=A0A8S3SHK2_MYTED|nr:unnamed protein product [Mytilus edulis]